MKKKFLFLFILLSASCMAQNSQDSTKIKFLVMLNGGVSIPAGTYIECPANQRYSQQQKYPDIYGYALIGEHVDATGIYMPMDQLGIAARYGLDINGTRTMAYLSNVFPTPYKAGPSNTVNQYMAGLYFSVCKQQSFINAYILGLAGMVTAMIPNNYNTYFNSGIGYENGYEQPGFGSGFGAYIGIGGSVKIYKWLHLDLSGGYLNASVITFQDGTVTTTDSGFPSMPTTTTVVNHYKMDMKLGIWQANAGIHFNFK